MSAHHHTPRVARCPACDCPAPLCRCYGDSDALDLDVMGDAADLACGGGYLAMLLTEEECDRLDARERVERMAARREVA